MLVCVQQPNCRLVSHPRASPKSAQAPATCPQTQPRRLTTFESPTSINSSSRSLSSPLPRMGLDNRAGRYRRTAHIRVCDIHAGRHDRGREVAVGRVRPRLHNCPLVSIQPERSEGLPLPGRVTAVTSTGTIWFFRSAGSGQVGVRADRALRRRSHDGPADRRGSAFRPSCWSPRRGRSEFRLRSPACILRGPSRLSHSCRPGALRASFPRNRN
ncbi:MAG: hypothetical protein JWQ81_7689 [Amycolatopsis sp.]|nr:hypothetical protein [Amycolatopsis sp.]